MPVRSQLTVRIPDDLRTALEENVARKRERRRNWNLTEEVLSRLYWSYRKQEEERRDPYMRALAFLLSMVAEQVHVHQSITRGREWHRDPFFFQAFKLGVIKLLDALEPTGEARSPVNPEGLRELSKEERLIADQWKTPETAGSAAANYVLRSLYRVAPEPDTWARLREWAKRPGLEPDGFNAKVLNAVADTLEGEFYAMSNVRRVLGIEEPKEPQS
jgi:hypothetical protein